MKACLIFSIFLITSTITLASSNPVSPQSFTKKPYSFSFNKFSSDIIKRYEGLQQKRKKETAKKNKIYAGWEREKQERRYLLRQKIKL